MNLIFNKKIADEVCSDISEYSFFQNLKQYKLIINEKKKEYMEKQFISKTNEVDYTKIPNYLYNNLISALNSCNYKCVEYNENYFMRKEEVFEKFNELIKTNLYENQYMFERYEYFDINIMKDLFFKIL